MKDQPEEIISYLRDRWRAGAKAIATTMTRSSQGGFGAANGGGEEIAHFGLAFGGARI
jgi:hypothetical protein